MEVDNTHLNHHIKFYENLLSDKIHNNFLKFCRLEKNYSQGTLAIDPDVKKHVTNKSTRNVEVFSLKNGEEEKSFTNIHWCNYLLHIFESKITDYFKNYKIPTSVTINDLALLKYTPGGFYKFHADHCPAIPRTLSLIYIVNDDYKGGNLLFGSVCGKKEIIVEKKKNTLVIWPSNFLFPHCVEPVEEGTRYSVVSWAL
tara:strand:+ start:2142 stop:2738 length:597 start_codon:yes stop_codon:yes gene_type:complete